MGSRRTAMRRASASVAAARSGAAGWRMYEGAFSPGTRSRPKRRTTLALAESGKCERYQSIPRQKLSSKKWSSFDHPTSSFAGVGPATCGWRQSALKRDDTPVGCAPMTRKAGRRRCPLVATRTRRRRERSLTAFAGGRRIARAVRRIPWRRTRLKVLKCNLVALAHIEEPAVRVDDGAGFASHRHLAVVHPNDLLAELDDAPQPMADHEDRACLVAELSHLVERLALEAGVSDRQRLVDEEDVGVHVDRHRKGEAAVHAGRVRAHRHVHDVSELGELRDVVVLLRELVTRESRGEAAQEDVVASGELAFEADAECEQCAHAPIPLAASLRWRKDSRHGAHERRLSGAVHAHDAENGSVRNLEGHVPHRFRLADDPLPATEPHERPLERRLLLDHRPVRHGQVVDLDGPAVRGGPAVREWGRLIRGGQRTHALSR